MAADVVIVPVPEDYALGMNEIIERLRAKSCSTPDGCWEWLGAKTRKGYGIISIKSRCVKVHRAAWEALKGAIGAGLAVCHHCDNRSCWNPEHLFLGTNEDNNHDMVRKGRHARGVRHGSVTHPEVRVRIGIAQRGKPKPRPIPEYAVKIRAIRAAGFGSQRELAEMFGIRQTDVSRILSPKTWAHAS